MAVLDVTTVFLVLTAEEQLGGRPLFSQRLLHVQQGLWQGDDVRVKEHYAAGQNAKNDRVLELKYPYLS